MPAGDDHTPTHEECIKAAASLGATRILSGSFFKFGNEIRIDARLEDVHSGAIVLGEKVVGSDPFALVDSPHQQARRSSEYRRSFQLSDVTQLVSANPEAYKQYVLGMEHFRHSDLDSAITNFEEAIAIDSSFALPYMRIGMAKHFQGRPTEGNQYFRSRTPSTKTSSPSANAPCWIPTSTPG